IRRSGTFPGTRETTPTTGTRRTGRRAARRFNAKRSPRCCEGFSASRLRRLKTRPKSARRTPATAAPGRATMRKKAEHGEGVPSRVRAHACSQLARWVMSRRLSCALFSLSVLFALPALGQTGNPPSDGTGAADLCQELLAYAEKKAAEPPKDGGGAQAATLPAAPPPRRDDAGSGTQGGGSVGPSASADTSSQEGAPTTVPVAPGAASEPATSPHASEGSSETAGAS